MPSAGLGRETPLLKTILDKSDLILCLFDESGLLVDCNETLWRNAQTTRERLVGRYVFDLHVSFPVQSREQWNELVDRIASKEHWELEVETGLGRRDGTTYLSRLVLSIVEHHGRRYVLVAGRRIPDIEPVRAKMEREARWQKALFDMANHESVLNGDLAGAVQFITSSTRLLFPAHSCHVWRLHKDSLQVLSSAAGYSVILSDYPWLRRLFDSGRAVSWLEVCTNQLESSATQALLQRHGSATCLAAPIFVSGNAWGAVTVGSTTEREWQPDELQFAAQVADQLAHAVLSQERRLAEIEIAASRERYRSFVEMSNELMVRIEFDRPVPISLAESEQVNAIIGRGFVADCNDALARLFGLRDAAQMRGQRLRRMAPGWGRRGVLFDLVRGGYQVKNKESAYLVRGHTVRVLESYQGIVENGLLIRLWGTARDITDFRRAQLHVRQSDERYRAFVANSSEGIVLTEYARPIPVDQPEEVVHDLIWSTGRIAECNQAFAQMRQLPREQIIGRPVTDFRLDTEYARRGILEFIRSGFRVSGLERPAHSADGCLHWYRYATSGIVENGCLVRTWSVITEVTEQKRLEEELRSLSSRSGKILEQERARVAAEIHDELGQQLTVLKFEASAIENGKRPLAKGKLTGEIDSIMQTVRRIATDLRPVILDQYGLGAAVEWQAREFARRTGIECHTQVDKDLQTEASLATTAFRILQEALTNVARHSGAKHVAIQLWQQEDRFQLTIQDDGTGVDLEGVRRKHTLGLVGMRERASQAGGSWAIEASPNGGTLVSLSLPMHLKEETTQ